MDARRDYTPPAIAAEDVLEQTSLACNATVPWPGAIGGDCFAGQPGVNFFPLAGCGIDVSKGGAFDDRCDNPFQIPDEVVALS